MVNQRVSDAIRRSQLYLDEHPLLRWFVVPLIFMAGIVILAGIILGVAPGGIGQIVVGFLVASTLAIIVGLALERVLIVILR